jgi:hypothetical protein
MLVEALVIGLVSYRLWRLIGADLITAPLRERITWPWMAELVACPWCLGTWLTIAVGLTAYLVGLTDSSPWLVIPAAATVCGLLSRID